MEHGPDVTALGLGIVTGVVLALGGGIVVLVCGRHGRLVAEPTSRERRLVRGAVAVLGVALATSAVLTLAGRSTVDPAEAVVATPVEMAGFEFRPGEIRSDGPDARLVVHNADVFSTTSRSRSSGPGLCG